VKNAVSKVRWFLTKNYSAIFVYLYFKKSIVMTTITLKINERTKAGKAFLEMTNVLVKDSKGIEIISTGLNKAVEKKSEIYDPEFVAMIKKAQKSKKRTVVDPNDIWGSLGLK